MHEHESKGHPDDHNESKNRYSELDAQRISRVLALRASVEAVIAIPSDEFIAKTSIEPPRQLTQVDHAEQYFSAN